MLRKMTNPIHPHPYIPKTFLQKIAFFNYEQYISGYPKMVLEYTTYQQKQIRIQGFLSEKKLLDKQQQKRRKKEISGSFLITKLGQYGRDGEKNAHN